MLRPKRPSSSRLGTLVLVAALDFWALAVEGVAAWTCACACRLSSNPASAKLQAIPHGKFGLFIDAVVQAVLKLALGK